MRTYARNGITIDQCTACHGIFLDRGELEQLISAENSYLAKSPHERRQADDKRSRGFLGELSTRVPRTSRTLTRTSARTLRSPRRLPQ